MKISFVIPAYNEEAYIGRCLDAIFREIDGRTDAEVIVVNNNSTDRTVEIVSRYPHVKLVNETRRGANSARQAGFAVSSGELVAFPDADTVMPPGWVAHMEKEFANDPRLVCLSGPFIYYDLPKVIQLLVRFFYALAYVAYLVSKVFLNKSTVVQGGNYAVRRWALEKIGGYDVGITFYGDDTDLALRLGKIGTVKFSSTFSTHSSGRRLAKEGTFTMGIRYGLNNLWMVLFHKPLTTVAKEIRLMDKDRLYAPENGTKEWTLVATSTVVILGIMGGFCYLAYYAIYWLAH